MENDEASVNMYNYNEQFLFLAPHLQIGAPTLQSKNYYIEELPFTTTSSHLQIRAPITYHLQLPLYK